MADNSILLSDFQLLAAAREGSDDAWEALLRRHRAPVEAVVRERCGRRAPAATEVAFETLRRAADDDLVGAGASPEFAIRAVRPRALALVTAGTYSPRVAAAVGEPPPPDLAGPATAASLRSLATAFGRLSAVWQTVLWHRIVDGEPAAAVAGAIGRNPVEVVGVEAAAERGLFESYLVVELEDAGRIEPGCRRAVALLGAYAGGTLSDAERRLVDAHVGPAAAPADDRTGDPTLAAAGCLACRQRLELRERFDAVLPTAVVPGLTGLTVDRYRAALGVTAAFGTAALVARRSQRSNQRARAGAVVAVVVALALAALLIRSPLRDLEGDIADLLVRTSTTTVPAVPDGERGDDGGPDGLPSRIELVFSGVPQGIAYVPGGPAITVDLGLSVPAPMYRGGTGTVDVALTNETDVVRTIEFVARASPGVSFEALAEGPGTCIADGTGATCAIRLAAGQTGSLPMRFALGATVPNRLVVAPNISPQVLDLPIETVPGLVFAQVTRGELAVGMGTFGPADISTFTLDVSPRDEIAHAALIWTGGNAGADWAGSVEVLLPGDPSFTSVSADSTVVGEAVEFRSVADVTELVRAGGGGDYTVRRPPDAVGDGTWALLVVTRGTSAPRRLIVVVDTVQRRSDPVAVEVPIASPVTSGPPAASVRPAIVRIEPAGPDLSADVNGAPLGSPGENGAYALDIDANDEALDVTASSASGRRIAVIGFAIDIVT